MALVHTYLMLAVLVREICTEERSIPKGSLTFVIDDTASMGEDIRQVKESVNVIFDTVTSTNTSQIENFVLVTFNDPGASLLTITKEKEDFKTALRGISVWGGGDCPEYAMKGIDIAVDHSLPLSYVYVFTDASAQDYLKHAEVQSRAKDKQIQVTFLLTGECGSRTSPDYQAYHSIADATSGQVFNMYKNDIKDVLAYVVDSVKSRSNILLEKKLPAGTHTIPFGVDPTIDNVTIAVSGKDSTIHVYGPDDEIVDTDTLVDKKEIKVKTFPKSKPGTYSTKVGSSSDKTVKVLGKTNLDFQHGFSGFAPTSLSDTSVKPAPDGSAYLSIQLVGEGLVKLQTAEILDMSGNILEELPLTLKNDKEKFYLSEIFYPPNESFKIKVIGYEEKTKLPVTRVSPTPIERQNPSYVKAFDVAPKVTIMEGSKLNVNYNEPIQLKCKVHGYPQPTIEWLDVDTSAVLPSELSVLEVPYDFISVLNIDKVTTNKTYDCKAINSLGDDKGTIKVETVTYFTILEKPKLLEVPYDFISVLNIDKVTTNKTYDCKAINSLGDDKGTIKVETVTYFTILEKPKRTKEIIYDENGSFTCKVDAKPSATVVWYKKGKQITNDTNIIISNDGSTITLEHVTTESRGIYKCEVKNELQTEVFHSSVMVTGLVEPQINKSDDLYVATQGEDVQLGCQIIAGIPKPTLKWSFQSPDMRSRGDDFEDLGHTDEILTLNKVTADQNGVFYKCTAANEVGTEQYAVELMVEYPPTIQDSELRLVAKDKATVMIPCKVNGVPSPTVTWFKDTISLEKLSDYKILSNHSLRFQAKLISSNGNYTCVAKNPLGFTNKTVSLEVFDPPQIKLPDFYTINKEIGDSVSLPCEADGYPSPDVHWIHLGFRNTGMKKIRQRYHDHDATTLNIDNLLPLDEGYYMCVASNKYASSNISYEVHIIAPPKINKKLQRNYSAVTGDLLIKIPCKASGEPKPTITWKKDSLDIAIGSEWYDVDEDVLIVQNIDKRTQGTYTCTAQNSVGKDTLDFNITVSDSPPNDTTVFDDLLIEEGKSEYIPCGVSYSSIAKMRWYKDSKLLISDELTLTNVKLEDAGIYICRVSDFVKSSSASVNVTVGTKPRFISKEDEDIEWIERDTVALNCSAKGYPTPTVSWKLNNKKLDTTEMIYELEMQLNNRGTYTCEVRNEFGTITRPFNIKSESCIFDTRKDFAGKNEPLILSTHLKLSPFPIKDGYMLIKEGEKFYLHCDQHFSRFPKKQILTATCEGTTKVKIQGVQLEFKNIVCKRENKPTVHRTGQSCHRGNTEIVNIGYKVNHRDFPVYEVCIDKDNHLPLYSKHELSFVHYNVPKTGRIYYPDKNLPIDLKSLYNCRNQVAVISYSLKRAFHADALCCFAKKQLVSPEDLRPGISTAVSYSNFNIVPHWSTCNSKNWEAVEENVRNLAKQINKALIIWTGTSGRYSMLKRPKYKDITIRDNKGRKQTVGKYLWKVVQDPSSFSSLAIIQVNEPDLTRSEADSYVPCTDICGTIEWMRGTDWQNSKNGYTFCCSVVEFESAFGLRGKFSGRNTNILYSSHSMLKPHSA